MMDRLPNVTFKCRVKTNGEWGWKDITTDELFKNKNVILFSLPGAFTPTCSTYQLPGFEKLYDDFKELGVDDIYCISVNDSFVMNAWGKVHDINNVKMEKFKILAQFIKDVSGETKDVQTFLFVKDNISKYQLTIDIITKPTKNQLVEVSTILKFGDKDNNERKSYFEIVYVSLVKIEDDVKEKKEIEKILLCEVQKKIQPNIEKAITDLINNSGFKQVSVKNIDFEKLYNSKFN